jgi:hypothetical protein
MNVNTTHPNVTAGYSSLLKRRDFLKIAGAMTVASGFGLMASS